MDLVERIIQAAQDDCDEYGDAVGFNDLCIALHATWAKLTPGQRSEVYQYLRRVPVLGPAITDVVRHMQER